MKMQIELQNAILFYWSDYIDRPYFELLQQQIDWQEKEIILFGKKIMQPRLVAFYGDENVAYKYSGQIMDAKPWTKNVLEIKRKIEQELNLDFNSCLLNYYRDGNDSMGWHQDNEKELGINPSIASVSIGGERVFKIKHIYNKEVKKDIVLSNGSLLYMGGEMQHYYKHAILKSKKYTEPRINMTFRNLKKLTKSRI